MSSGVPRCFGETWTLPVSLRVLVLSSAIPLREWQRT